MYNRIKELFKESRLTNAELERAIGLPSKVIDKWNRGDNHSYKKYISNIALYFGVSTDYLLGRTDNPNTEEPAVKKDGGQKEIYDIIESLSPDNRAKLLELARLFLDAQHKSEEKK